MSERRLLRTQDDVRKALGVGKATVSRWMAAGVFPNRVNRHGWDPDEVKAWHAEWKGRKKLERKQVGKAVGRAAHGYAKRDVGSSGSGVASDSRSGSFQTTSRSRGESSSRRRGGASHLDQGTGLSRDDSGSSMSSRGTGGTEAREGSGSEPPVSFTGAMTGWDPMEVLDPKRALEGEAAHSEPLERVRHWQAVQGRVAYLKEIELLVSKEQVDRLVGEFAATLVRELGQLPGRLALKCAGKGAKEIEALAEREIRAQLTRLATLGG